MGFIVKKKLPNAVSAYVRSEVVRMMLELALGRVRISLSEEERMLRWSCGLEETAVLLQNSGYI